MIIGTGYCINILEFYVLVTSITNHIILLRFFFIYKRSPGQFEKKFHVKFAFKNNMITNVFGEYFFC